jgi:hypothetical protein
MVSDRESDRTRSEKIWRGEPEYRPAFGNAVEVRGGTGYVHRPTIECPHVRKKSVSLNPHRNNQDPFALRACLGTVVSAIFREGINPSPTKTTGVVVVVAGFIPA